MWTCLLKCSCIMMIMLNLFSKYKINISIISDRWLKLFVAKRAGLFWTSVHQTVERLIARSREVSTSRDSGLDFCNHSEI